MNLQEYQIQAELAVRAFQQGDYRESANRYLASFRATPGIWADNRWHIFHGYTSILQEAYFPATEKDVEDLTKIGHNKKEGVLYRVEAAFTAGLLSHDRKNREDAGDYYRSAIRIAKKATDKDRKRKVMSTLLSADGNSITGFGLKPVGEILDGIVEQAENNLAQMENVNTYAMNPNGNPTIPVSEPKMRSNGTAHPSSSRNTQIMVGPRPTTLTKEQVNRLLAVGGSNCDCCGRTAKEVGRKSLMQCSQCSKAFYCSAECQKSKWKAGHKNYCRKPGQFKKGDYVRIDGIQSRPEINGMLVELVDVDPNNPDTRWQVTVPGGDHAPISIATTKMEQLRPLE